jgi:hypothetical protein
VQQRALAGARRADDRDRLAALHRKVDALQHRDVEARRAAAFGEALVQVGRVEDRAGASGRRRVTHSAALRPAGRGSRASSGTASRGTPSTSEITTIGTMSLLCGSLGILLIR